MGYYARDVSLILLAIIVVLLVTFSYNDYFTLLFYNLGTFVLAYDPVYKNDKDTPETIAGNVDPSITSYWISSIYDFGSFSQTVASRITNSGQLGGSLALETWQYQRPVLYLNNQYSNACLYHIDTEVIQSYIRPLCV